MEGFREVILANLERYPLSEIQDLYKLAHQATMGSEHAVESTETARDWLLRELEELRENPSEPLIDPISGDGKIVRIHLWPFRQVGGDPNRLLQAFVKTAHEHLGSHEQLREYVTGLERLAEEGAIHFSPDDIYAYIGERDSEGFPAVHHSSRYAAAYHPNYRVVAGEFLPKELQNFD